MSNQKNSKVVSYAMWLWYGLYYPSLVLHNSCTLTCVTSHYHSKCGYNSVINEEVWKIFGIGRF